VGGLEVEVIFIGDVRKQGGLKKICIFNGDFKVSFMLVKRVGTNINAFLHI
jgi:hypothetical protein